MGKNIFFILLVSLYLPAINLLSWDSNADYKKLSTHTFLSIRGYEILGSEVMFLSPQMDTSLLLGTLDEMKREENWGEFLSGSVAPDNQSRNLTLYQDHFWDPDTDENYSFTNLENVYSQEYHTVLGNLFKNFLAYIGDTAETRVREYFAEAVYLWKVSERARALYYLGMASHYLEDICCPVHATNTIGVLDYKGQHLEFEKFVEQIKENYTIGSTDIKVDTPERDPLDRSWYLKVIKAKYIADVLRELSVACGKNSKSIIDDYYTDGIQFGEPVFNNAAISTMATAQKAESILIFAFVCAVNTGSTPSADKIIFDVTISTRDGSWGKDYYGTDNAIFWGIEFKDGRRREQYCGRKSHKMGGRDSYSMEITGETGQDVRKMWVRKARILPFCTGWVPMAEDNWYPILISLTSSDKGVNFLAETHNWIKGNEGIVFDIDETEIHTPMPLKNRKKSAILP